MPGHAVVLAYFRSAIMIPIVGVTDIAGMEILQLNLEAMTLLSGVIHRVKIVDAAIGGAGLDRCGREQQ
jgi:hypothetical protein